MSFRERAVLKRTALAVALSFSFASGVALAQSNASGSIFGSSGDPGSTVIVRSADTGQTRTVTIDANGRYRVTALPVGKYSVTLQRDGQTIGTQDNVVVLLGSGSEVSFATQPQTLDAVVVTGANLPLIDVSSVDTRSVFTAEQIEQLTVARNLNALALLTPGVVAGDSRYNGVPSFGGSSASENAYYINGYAVTNPYTALGSTTLPFNSIDQYQAITGGYSAEFGRATGGVVNIISKRGTNQWEAGAQVVWTPESLRSTRRNIYYPTNTGYATDGTLYQRRDRGENDSITYGASVGGPIIKDKLFFYASGEFTRTDQVAYAAATATAATRYQEYDYEIPRWLAKFDWNITDNHSLELTAISDVTKETDTYHPYSYVTNEINRSTRSGWDYEDGGELYIGKYTGHLTDNLTVTALYGQQKQDHTAVPYGLNPSATAVYVTDGRPSVINKVTGLQSVGTLPDPQAYDKTDGGRLDLEWQVGSHTLRAGLDQQDLEVRRGTTTTGPGYYWAYATDTTPNTPISGSGGAAGPGGNGDYVRKVQVNQGGTFRVEQSAQYIEDRWQINDRWLLSLGLRNEQFSNYDSLGRVYVEQRNQLAPRLGVAWDVNGDASFKVFANAGRYHLALPNRTAYRQAAPSLNTSEYFAFTGIDPATGEPLGLTPLGDGPFSPNNEYGQAKNPTSIAARNLKSHYQDEFVVGFEKLLTDNLNFGSRFVWRDLKSAIEDLCDPRPGVAWAEANGVDAYTDGGIFDSFYSCRLFNPGEDNTFTITDDAGVVTVVPLTAEQLGFPKLKRRYLALDFFLEHKFDGKFYGKIDYTWSHNYGNAEGQLLSDLGQSDVSATQTFDYPELSIGSSGNLPNDRRHYVKAFGYYQFTPEWQVSGTFSAASGRPLNRLGIYPISGEDEIFDDYVNYGGPYYFYNDGQIVPRGSVGNLPWTIRFDLGATWRPAFASGKLQVRADVFNLFDRQTPQNVIEYWENPDVGFRYSQAHRVISYADPRTFRFQIRYDY